MACGSCGKKAGIRSVNKKSKKPNPVIISRTKSILNSSPKPKKPVRVKARSGAKPARRA